MSAEPATNQGPAADRGPEGRPGAPEPAGPPPSAPKSNTPEELRAEVAEARERLGGTVEQLAARADVKALMLRKTARMRGRVNHSALRAGHLITRSGPRQLRRAGTPALVAAGTGTAALITAAALRTARRRRGAPGGLARAWVFDGRARRILRRWR
ncbi:DUF3618 domain-containing protein [Streptomyces sp. TP-A0874]|uniref:DUF3618 domain-containing protein n=1 Tax=Streptomyces sp. TP-A0874 TaxID=549819 RepID=UPI00147A7FCF|nr:DUF3618 domain-containing protein [Streptomyces sp. TP-A0874]